MCKLLEHIIVSAVMCHFEENSILTDNQHGFRRGRSCETQLLELVEELTMNLESGKQTDVLIMDFSKVFDKVNHSCCYTSSRVTVYRALQTPGLPTF